MIVRFWEATEVEMKFTFCFIKFVAVVTAAGIEKFFYGVIRYGADKFFLKK